MTRIIAGSLGGRRLRTPPGQDTRPTSDRVRESLFGALDARLDLAGTAFADLYAGSGAVGLEANSRGATDVLLVESDPRAARVARDNVATLGAAAAVRIAAGPVEAVTARRPERVYDVIFADPPYPLDETALGRVLEQLTTYHWVAPNGLVVIERSARGPEPAWPAALRPEKPRRYGETVLWWATHEAANDGDRGHSG